MNEIQFKSSYRCWYIFKKIQIPWYTKKMIRTALRMRYKNVKHVKVPCCACLTTFMQLMMTDVGPGNLDSYRVQVKMYSTHLCAPIYYSSPAWYDHERSLIQRWMHVDLRMYCIVITWYLVTGTYSDNGIYDALQPPSIPARLFLLPGSLDK